MQKWLQISLLLCTFGFFRELRPSEPFVTEYLAGDWRNLTMEQVYQEVYPFGTYSVLALLVVVFLITDMLRYKPVIIASAVAGIILFAILLWTRTIWELRLGQLFFGLFAASEVAYYTYIYAKVDRAKYQIVTGHTRAAILCGKCIAGVLAQILVSTDSMSFRELHFISFATQIISLLISILLPSVPLSLYFYSSQANSNETNSANTPPPPKFSFGNACRLVWQHLVSAYTNPVVIQWSIWWAFASCGQIQVISYIQFLWKEIAPDNLSKYNGIVEAVATILGAGGALVAGILNSNKNRTLHLFIVCVCTCIIGVLLVTAGATHYVLIAYANYVAFSGIFFFIITIAASIIANNLVDDSFGLVFGINTLVALILQTILIIVVVTDSGFGLHPREQYYIYGCFFFALTLFYGLFVCVPTICRKCRQAQDNPTEAH